MSEELKGKTAIVTGASRGIGRAVATELAARGASVVLGYVGNEARAKQAVKHIADKGGVATALRVDLSKTEDIVRFFDAAHEAYGQPDIVVANAGDALAKPLVDCTEQDYERIFGTNARGTFFTLREAALRVRDGGRIIATSTGGTNMWMTELSLYLGSKGAVEQFVRVLSRELGARDIAVNAVSPGFTDTDMLPDRDREVAASASAFGRVGQPEDVAEVIAFLAGAGGRWVTGQNIAAGGGVF
ncbi:MAG TPA: SDR family oxidoreductase [Pseudonocardiaceae bacterium]|nr:SDR family oxidoreductase [Pseudonocardiaceae bacterium]